ncbi:hypothetical protein ACZ91_63385 [Streptomyces regensis]|nr:hypothetical protein ACZ91_63385 [Streptomyces regensis]
MSDLIKARNEVVANVRAGVLDFANVTQVTGDGPVTADSILGGLTDRLDRARQFAEQLAGLQAKGGRADLIAQIAGAGVEGGLGTASALANASAAQIKQINSTQSQIVKAAGQAGWAAADGMYESGIRAAQGLVQGLQSQKSAIEKTMVAIAKSMTAAIRLALGIKSPSRVLADRVGRWIPLGIQRGIDAGAPALDRSMAALVTPPSVPALGGRPAAARPDAVASTSRGPVVLEIRSSGSRMDDLILESLRHSIQTSGGGAVKVLERR